MCYLLFLMVLSNEYLHVCLTALVPVTCVSDYTRLRLPIFYKQLWLTFDVTLTCHIKKKKRATTNVKRLLFGIMKLISIKTCKEPYNSVFIRFITIRCLVCILCP